MTVSSKNIKSTINKYSTQLLTQMRKHESKVLKEMLGGKETALRKYEDKSPRYRNPSDMGYKKTLETQQSFLEKTPIYAPKTPYSYDYKSQAKA